MMAGYTVYMLMFAEWMLFSAENLNAMVFICLISE